MMKSWTTSAKIFAVLLAILALATAISTIPTERGAVRMLDFVREPVFYLSSGLALLAALLAAGKRALLAGGFAIVAVIQLWHFWPYFELADEQLALDDTPDRLACFSALSLNVKQSNEGYGAVAQLIERSDPDILLLMETNERWMRALAPQIAAFPNTLASPLDNSYGMAFASKLAVRKAAMPTPTSADSPTLYATLEARGGAVFEFIGLHPRPPLPGESTQSRDENIARAAALTPDRLTDAVVMGDFNDVPWSSTTGKFRTDGGWKDPRIGRGTFPSFPADYVWAGWPLDQLMVKNGVSIKRFELLKDVGADHLPMLAELCVGTQDADPARPTQDDRPGP